jgi:Glyoxalase/Bleomycin resistance protein/Dioxygenase superfamily
MDHYHVGIVVTDIETASAKLSALLGVTWGPIVHLDAVEYRDETGHDVTLPTTMRYSTGTPCLELILEVPGSPWVRNDFSNLHHIGFWSDSLPEHSEAFSAAGCPMQLCGRSDGDAPTSFAYHRDHELGIRVELVDDSRREMMQFLFEPQPPKD